VRKRALISSTAAGILYDREWPSGVCNGRPRPGFAETGETHSRCCAHTHLSVIWAGCSGVSKTPGVPPLRFLAYTAAGQVLSYLFVFMMCTLCVQAAVCQERSPEWLKGHCVQSWGLLRLHRFTWRGRQRQSVGCHQTLLPTGVPSGHTHLVLVYAKLVGVIDVFGCNASARFPLHGAV
jgi:hypothetical protein